MHPDDVANLTNQNDDWTETSPSIVLKSDLVDELDLVLKSGMLTVHGTRVDTKQKLPKERKLNGQR